MIKIAKTQTIILSKNSQSAIKAIAKKAFLCIAKNEDKERLMFNETIFAVDLQSASISKLAKFARSQYLTDVTHCIFQVCPSGTVFTYSIDKN